MSNEQKDGNVIHIPETCEECWFYYDDGYSPESICFNERWCGLLSKFLSEKECNYKKVTIE